MYSEDINYECIKNVSIVGIAFNILLAITKYFIGNIFCVNSLTVDSFHSLEDSVSSIFGLISSKLITKKPTINHPYGYEKIEYLISLIIGLFMILIGLIMLISSFKNIINLNKIEFSYIILIICNINICIKFLLYIYAKNNYKKTNSVIIQAIMIDHRNDCIITVCTILSIIISYLGFYYIDGIFGMILSIFIIISGSKIFLNSGSLLIDKGLDKENINKLKDYLESFNYILNVNKIISRKLDEKYLVVVSIIMDKALNLEETTNKINVIKKEILNEFVYLKNIIITVDTLN